MKNENSLAQPLQNLLSQAKKLPATGIVEKLNRRMTEAKDAKIVLADVSSSMNESAGSKRKVDHLLEALRQISDGKIIAFSSNITEISHVADLPQPSGGTALHLALETAAKYRPYQTIVVSDGRPDSESAALNAAAAMTGRIDVIYIGPDDDKQAIAFMNRLARMTGGQVIVHDIVKMKTPLLAPMKKLLASNALS